MTPPVKIIGTPGAGTHSWTATPNNWESDNAIDVAIPKGTPIYAVSSGRIGPASQFGAQRSSDPHMAGLRLHLVSGVNEFFYQHLSKIVVHPGQSVKKGQLLGYSGEAVGVEHLHFAAKHGTPNTAIAKLALGDHALPKSVQQLLNPSADIESHDVFDVAGGLVTGAAGAVGDAVDSIPGVVGGVAAAAAEATAKALVGLLVDAIGKDGARVVLWLGLVGVGVVGMGVGIGRVTGLGEKAKTAATLVATRGRAKGAKA